MLRFCFRRPFHKKVIDSKEGGEKKAGERSNLFWWTINGFSTIANRGADTYYSRSFTAFGFNWKLRLGLVLEEDGEKYVCLYLLNDDAASKGSEIKAIYRLFIYDQLHGEHIQKEGEDYFHSKSLDGPCFKVALNKFDSSKSGLLVNDRCVFGAQVLQAFAISKSDKEGIHESWSLNKDLTPRKHTWAFKDVSKSNVVLQSKAFAAGGYNWYISLYPNLAIYKDDLGVFLTMHDATSLASNTGVYVEFSLCLLDLDNAKHRKCTAKALFSSATSLGLGWRKFLSWKEVQDPSRGFLRNDICIVEASVVVLGVNTIA
ncbi:uncharacterized protein LOC141823620 [Curcuma longa]|uniref:uncharacterized protein LOC141823620 n=1 Tax=Curcuma longa TaxID=136217 RepID=UPI003D9E3F6A